MPEVIAVVPSRHRLHDLGVEQAAQCRLELLVGQGDRRRQQRAVDLRAGGSCGCCDRDRGRRRVQTGDQRLVQRGRHRARERSDVCDGHGIAGDARPHELLEVQRDAAAARRQRQSLLLVLPRLQGVDQLEPAGLAERAQLGRLPRPAVCLSRCRDYQQALRLSRGQHGQQLAGRGVEPVQILGHDERPPATGGGEDVAACRLGDLFLQPGSFRGDLLVTGARRDPGDRREQRQHR